MSTITKIDIFCILKTLPQLKSIQLYVNFCNRLVANQWFYMSNLVSSTN